MRKNSNYDEASDKVYIEISANTNTLTSEMIVKNNYEIHIRRYKSSNSLLGYHSKLHTSGYNEYENMVNILTINSILVNIDLISGSYVNGSTQLTLYSFFTNVSHSFTILLTDQNGRELNLRESICQCDFI